MAARRDRAHIAPLLELCALTIVLPAGGQAGTDASALAAVDAAAQALPDGACSAVKLAWELARAADRPARGARGRKVAGTRVCLVEL